MIALLYKYCLWMALLAASPAPSGTVHPIYVSVTEIEYNPAEKTLEISCRIFTDDFEKTLRKYHPGKIDLLNAALKKQMEPLVSGYIGEHLQLEADGKKCTLVFLGYEQQEEAIAAYFQVSKLPVPKKLQIFNNLLYEYQPQQMGIIHATINGERKSQRLNNPETGVVMEW